jgi:hypothetical protein
MLHEGELTVLAAEYGVGAPGASWRFNNGDLVIQMEALSSANGWDTFEAWGSDLPDPADEPMADAIEAFVAKLWASPLRATSRPEWHPGNIMYNDQTHEILRIDWDPVEGGCRVGTPEPHPGMLESQADYIDAITDAANEARRRPPERTPPGSAVHTKIVPRLASTAPAAPSLRKKRKRGQVHSKPGVSRLRFEAGFADACALGLV